MRLPFSRSGGPGFEALERVAAAQGAELGPTYLLDGGRAREATLRFGRHRLRWATNGNRLYLSIPTPKVAVSLNVGRHPDLPWETRVVRTVRGLPVYLKEAERDGERPRIEATERWLRAPAHIELLDHLGLVKGEWASVVANWTLASLVSRGGDSDRIRLELLLQIVDSATDPSAAWLRERRINASATPEPFRSLLPWVRKWAIDDDGLRSNKLARARTSTLLSLWQAVGPMLVAIDDHMAKEGDSAPHEMLRVDRLAEATAEARLELERRGVDRRILDQATNNSGIASLDSVGRP